jgi:tRNA (guanine-N7-)-methyltransferase
LKSAAAQAAFFICGSAKLVKAMHDENHSDRPDLRSYGRRRGRKPSDRQARLLSEVLPRIAFDVSQPPMPSGRLREAESEGITNLEIGFGGGEHLLWQVRANPAQKFIGCEPFEDGVVKVLSAIDDEKIENVRIHMGDARDVLRALPDASISRAFILFPDPWPKKKHRKRRLVNAETIALLARVIKSDGELRLGTDIGDYAAQMLDVTTANSHFQWLANGPSDWRVRPDDWPGTRYEAKAEREGRKRYYFRFSRT